MLLAKKGVFKNMHELSYAQSMIDQIETCLQKETFHRVKCVNLKIGKISGIEPTALDFCFESCSKGTLLEGAKLNIEVIPYKIHCNTCKHEEILDDYSHVCPNCLKTNIQVLGGQEIELTNLEVD